MIYQPWGLPLRLPLSPRPVSREVLPCLTMATLCCSAPAPPPTAGVPMSGDHRSPGGAFESLSTGIDVIAGIWDPTDRPPPPMHDELYGDGVKRGSRCGRRRGRRLRRQARTTKGADATWRAALDHLGDLLEAALDTDLGVGFRFEAAGPRPMTAMTAEPDEEGLRDAILARRDGRELERLQLDVNAAPDDQRPSEHLGLRALPEFAGIAPPSQARSPSSPRVPSTRETVAPAPIAPTNPTIARAVAAWPRAGGTLTAIPTTRPTRAPATMLLTKLRSSSCAADATARGSPERGSGTPTVRPPERAARNPSRSLRRRPLLLAACRGCRARERLVCPAELHEPLRRSWLRYKDTV